MTIGDKIQFYRKELGLSQEELAQKLLVSRQTISLWEKGQTSPTIDNLIRLKEILGVSVDEILEIKNDIPADPILPAELYQFNYSIEELTEIYKCLRNRLIKRPILFFVTYAALLLSCLGTSVPDIFTGVVLGVFLVGIASHIRGIRAFKKNWRKGNDKVAQSRYEYKIYDDYLTISIQRNGETVRTSKTYFQDIEQIQDIGGYLLLIISGQTFILRKGELPANSAVYTLLNRYLAKAVRQPPAGKWKVWSLILFIGSLLSIFGAIFLVGTVSEANHHFNENMWLFFLLTPIPIASIILGFCLRKRGYKYKKNIVAGIIMTVILCIYGSFTFIFDDTYLHSDVPVAKLEQYTAIDIPDYEQINTLDWTQGTQDLSRGYIYLTSDVYFNFQNADQLENRIVRDDRWLSYLPNDLVGISSPVDSMSNYDYILIYNTDENSYNALPSKDGTYHFMSALYRAEDHRMNIVEYDIRFITNSL